MHGADTAELRARWIELTKVVLPGMAEAAGWPIRLDHCFMRVFLDNAMAGPWHETVRRPAIWHMKINDFARAVSLAEAVVRDPSMLPGLNAKSLAWRRAARKG